MITLSSWLSAWNISIDVDCELNNLVSNSSSVVEGDVFLAYNGGRFDGRDYISDAISKGAAVIIYEHPYSKSDELISKDVIFIPFEGLYAHRAKLASAFYNNPSNQLHTIAITGTDGKTSCADFIAQAITVAQGKCGVIGTLGVGVWPSYSETGMTTVDSVEMISSCHMFLRQQVATVVTEASSHGLALGRLDETAIDTAVFTGLSQDHLDFHGSILEYKKAKMSLFLRPELKHAVINIDDSCGQEIVALINPKVNVIAISCVDNHFQHENISSYIVASNIVCRHQGISLCVETNLGRQNLDLNLLGMFNVYNILNVIGVLSVSGCDLKDIAAMCNNMAPVIGRMQVLGGNDKPVVVVDYAHTANALEQVLSSLKSHCDGKLWCVFGCGGDRDRSKRPLMARAAAQYADHIIITTDNPRSEDIDQIMNDIKQGFGDDDIFEIQLSRQKAIAMAVQLASKNDMVLIAGKGHETKQVMRHGAVPFSDIEESVCQLKIKS